jgi:hypothetical protein
MSFMKNHAFIPFIIFCMLVMPKTQAQTPDEELHSASLSLQLRPEVRGIIQNQIRAKNKTAQKTTNTELLVGSSVSFPGIGLLDSIIYKYSANRGSNVTNDDINSYYDDYDKFLPISHLNPMHHWDVSYLLYDTMQWVSYNQWGGMHSYDITGRYYDAWNNIIKEDTRAYDSIGNLKRHSYMDLTFDANNNLTNGVTYEDTSSTLSGIFGLKESLVALYTANKRILDTTVYYFGYPAYYTVYTYNTAGELATSLTQILVPTTGIWENNSRATYNYDAVGRLATAKIENWITGAWELMVTDSFGYTGSSAMYTFHEGLGYLGNAVSSGSRLVYTLTSFNAVDSAYEYYLDEGNWKFPSFKKATYNANEHLASLTTYSFDMNTGTWNTTPYRVDRFYYDFPQGMNEIHKNEAALATLYPNPATGEFTIKLFHRSKQVQINIYNSFGQLIQQQSRVASQSVQINLGTLPAGNYVAQVMMNGQSQNLKFVKQ